MAKSNIRAASVKINLTPEMHDRLKQLAERQGQVPAVLAAVAVGQYVSAHMAPLDMQTNLTKQVVEMIERMPQQLLDLDKKGLL